MENGLNADRQFPEVDDFPQERLSRTPTELTELQEKVEVYNESVRELNKLLSDPPHQRSCTDILEAHRELCVNHRSALEKAMKELEAKAKPPLFSQSEIQAIRGYRESLEEFLAPDDRFQFSTVLWDLLRGNRCSKEAFNGLFGAQTELKASIKLIRRLLRIGN